MVTATVGGAVCLDFVNTGSQRRLGPFEEKLNSYGDLVDWAVVHEVLPADVAADLGRLGTQHPVLAERVLERGRQLREATYRVFSAQARGDVVAPVDLEVISAEYANATAHRVLTPNGDGAIDFRFRDESTLERPLWPIAISAANLATSDEAVRVKECATENCNWLFYDASKNRSRRWCEMSECGNRAKARRHYHRRRS